MRHITLLFLCFTVLHSYAQDRVFFCDGDSLDINVIEISQNEVRGRKVSNPDGPLYTFPTNTIYKIKYKNGEIEQFNSIASQTSTKKSSPIPSELNQHNILHYNKKLPLINSPLPKSPCNHAVIFWHISDSSILSSEEVDISFNHLLPHNFNASTSLTLYPYTIQISNKTSDFVYIDLKSTVRQERTESTIRLQPWHDGNSSRLETSTSAASVAFGSTSGRLLGITNVNNNVSLSNKSLPDLIAIPPYSAAILPSRVLATKSNEVQTHESLTLATDFGAKQQISILPKELRIFEEENSPWHIDYFITYSTKRDLSDCKTLPIHLFTKAAYGCKQNAKITPKLLKLDNIDGLLIGNLYIND